jgi:WD40 repeat protein/DNA-binding SARP family transcriptional activator
LARTMEIRVLGPLEVSIHDQPVALGGAKQRAVLAMLGLEANRAVAADRLIEGLWGEQPPPSAAKMVQNYVWRLRGMLNGDGGAEIITRGRAYELHIDRELVDVCRLERLVSEASRASEAGRPDGAAREALALFRGEPLADLADEPFAPLEIRRLEDLRQTAAELAIEADLVAGRHQQVLGEIDALLAANPWRERLHAQRMLALYRCGRQAEALEAYRHARETLVEEIGIEPTPELRGLHDAILRQDPALDVEPAAAELPRELDPASSPPLIGRDEELSRLQTCWQRAAAGSGALVALVGAYGMGKTRLAAEIAAAAHREGATVRYAAGTGAPEAALAMIAQAHDARGRALVVLDDADRAPAKVRAALRALVPALERVSVLVLATGQEAAALAALAPQESLALEPLGAESVRAIAGFYAPTGSGDGVPVETLLATSRGVARRVHEVASEWARHAATQRVDEVAGRAAAGRSEAWALEAELAGSVVDLQSARERADLVARRDDGGAVPVVCPYKGLATFEAEDAEYFFGRERLVAELAARLVGAPLLAVVGPSGSGKSSVVRAGLLPALAGGVLPGSEEWTQAVIRPGTHPQRELHRVHRRLDREWRSVLLVDQFEELFTHCEDERERSEFVAALVRAARDRTVVVLAVRADFYGRCAEHPELSRLLGANHVLVGPMARDELRRAIERPAERVGLSVEPELVEALLADVDDQPGALPLLSTALLELWLERDGHRLRLAAYARSGGVQGAVARLAEDAYVGLDPPRQEIARKLLLRLTDEDEGSAVVRRRIPLSELEDERDAEVAAELTDRRLLTVSDGAVEVAHEALLREWPRLRGWLDEDVEGRRLHHQLGAAARAWDADGRDPGGLYRGARLAAALDWAASRDPGLTATERAFLDVSRSASGRAQRRLRLVLAGVASLLVLAVIAGLVALDQRGRARDEATAAAAEGLGAQALADGDLDRSLLLARQGVALDDTSQTRSNLLAALLKSPAAVAVLHGDGDGLTALDVSPGGRTLAYIDTDGTLRRIDTETLAPVGRPVTVPSHVVWGPRDVRFSGDGSRLAIGGYAARIYDARTLHVITQLKTEQLVYSVQFSPDGRSLFAVIEDSSDHAFLQRFDARTGVPGGEPRFITGPPNTVTLLVTRDGGRVVTTFAGGPTVIWDARTLSAARELPAGGEAAALSPDDRTLLLGGRDGSVRFVDLDTGRARTASGRHDSAVLAAAFGADGRTAVTAGEDSRAILWDVGRAAAGETFAGHSGTILGAVISRDGRTLYTAATDGKALMWDLAGDRRFGRRFTTGPRVIPDAEAEPQASHALSPDGRTLAVGRQDGTVALLDARTLRERSQFRAVEDGPVLGIGFIPGGPFLAVGGDDGFLAVFDPRDGSLVRRLPGHTQWMRAPSFSADGRLMATNSPSGVLVWRVRGGLPDARPQNKWQASPAGTTGAAVSPDGRTIAVTSPIGVDILDAATLRPRNTGSKIEEPVSSARFSPDGRVLALGTAGGETQLWSTRTWKPVSRAFGGHTDEVLEVAISPDGQTLASGSWDGTVRLFDIATQQPLGAPLRAVPNRVVEPEFTPDGAFLFAVTSVGKAYRWDVRPSAWAHRACAVAGRSLTRTEWSDVLPGRKYDPAC